MAKKKNKNRSQVFPAANKLFPVGNGKVEVYNFSGGMMGIRRRSHSTREVADAERNEHWIRCIDYFRERCAYCLRKPIGGEILTKDHFIPKSENGKNIASNIIPACDSCNNKKGNKQPNKWCTEKQLERIYTYFWDFRISMHKTGRHTVVWKALGLGE